MSDLKDNANATSEGSLRIPKLEGKKNYSNWSSLLRLYLLGRNEWKYVEGSASTKQEDEAWEVCAARVSSLILMCCNQPIQRVCASINTPKEIWVYLKKNYGETGRALEMTTYQTWMTLEYDGKSLQTFLEQYQQCLFDLDSLGIQLDEKLRVYELIRRVDSHFPLWTQVQRSEIRSKDGPLKIEDLIESLQEQHQALTHSAHVAKQSTRKKVTCLHCKKPNHTEATCYQKHPYLRLKNNGGSRADKGDKPIQHHAGFTVTTVTPAIYRIASRKHSRDDWIFDTGASAHCINKLEHFDECEPCSQMVSVGNNDYLKATHIGRITRTLLAPDGTLHSIVIGGCLYVPDMVANLISGEVLRSKGLFYRNDTQSLFLKDGSIIGQVRSIRGLPQLVQSASASAVALHTKRISPSVATADLWHLRYGHISGQALKQAVEMHQGIKVDGDINISPCSACAQATGYRQFARTPPGHPQEPYSELCIQYLTNQGVTC